jgi:hypothetical protein
MIALSAHMSAAFQEGMFGQRYLLSNNASETVTDEHDRPLVILSNCEHDFQLWTETNESQALLLLQCEQQFAQAILLHCFAKCRGASQQRHRRGIHTSRRAILVNRRV